jgi:hypothetical protein
MNTEPTGVKFDSAKPDYSLIPAHALEEVTKVLTYGAKKYDRENWRKLDDLENRYFAAAQRHIWATKKGEPNDPETGISHLAHAIASLMFLIEHDHETRKKKERSAALESCLRGFVIDVKSPPTGVEIDRRNPVLSEDQAEAARQRWGHEPVSDMNCKEFNEIRDITEVGMGRP